MPNPAMDFIKINQEFQSRIQIFSLIGLKVLDIDFKEEIDVSILAPGVYFVKVGDNIKKFIKY